MRLLLAEDEQELSKAIVTILRHNNYSVDAVYDGVNALDWALSENYDAILLDIMMPGMNGIEVLQRLRAKGISTPVILLTAKTEIDDRIIGLDSGADDYITKPFAMGELLARVRAVTRRKANFHPNIIMLGNLSLNREIFEISTPHGSFKLAGKEFQMLEMLMTEKNRIVSVDQFMDRIWGFDSDTDSSVVWVYISYLRKKLSIIKADVEIKATRGVGYSIEKKL